MGPVMATGLAARELLRGPHADVVLAIGGQPSASLATTEVLSLGAGNGNWAAGASLITGRSNFQAVQLVDGRILIAGGCFLHRKSNPCGGVTRH